MSARERLELPGSRVCVGCRGLTFRQREDQLCPRCAFGAEQLMEQIELESLAHDLSLMTRFEAYCCERDRNTADAVAYHGLAGGTPGTDALDHGISLAG